MASPVVGGKEVRQSEVPLGISRPPSSSSLPNINSLTMTEYSPSPSRPTSSAGLVPAFDIPRECLLPTGYPDYLRLILTSKVYEVIKETPLTRSSNLSNRYGCNIFLKREDLLPVFSFKLRGAYNKMAHMAIDKRYKGVIAVSAGNHAQGVAYSARKLGIPATIVMPLGAPAIKVHNVQQLGALAKLEGQDFDEAKAHAQYMAEKHDLAMVAPFDDPYVIAGQGTIAIEILRQTSLQDLEAVFCCVGGGGLIAGIGSYIKRLAPHIKIIGVETQDANAMVQSLRAGCRVKLDEVGLFADGAAVKHVGEETFRLCMDCVDEVIEVNTDELCAAIKDVFNDTRAILEPAGALSVAGLKKWVVNNPPKSDSVAGSDSESETDPSSKSKPIASKRKLVAVASGANMNFDRLRFVAERAKLGEDREVLLSVDIPERPGAFAELVATVGENLISEFTYRYSQAQSANIMMSVEISDKKKILTKPALLARLQKEFKVVDVSDNDLAKSHIRYLVGGHANVENERLYSFEFPERPNALAKFLMKLKPGFNISLFHYRGDSGDIGRVLAGIQCPAEEASGLAEFLHDLGYPWKDESENPIYHQFMRPSKGEER